jgi:hypothetical protein
LIQLNLNNFYLPAGKYPEKKPETIRQIFLRATDVFIISIKWPLQIVNNHLQPALAINYRNKSHSQKSVVFSNKNYSMKKITKSGIMNF